MAGQAIAGEAILKNSVGTKAEPSEAIGNLVAEHTGMVFRIAWSILRNHHDAEDAVQECFLRAVKYVRDLEHVRNTKTWLGRIAWTTSLDRRAQREAANRHDGTTRRTTTEEDNLPPDLPDTRAAQDEELAAKQMQGLLARMIAALPEDLRHPLELSTVQELNSAEIAELMGIPESSVRTRLMRARKMLKEKLAVLLEVKRG